MSNPTTIEGSLLVGKRVVFSRAKDSFIEGTVLDKILCCPLPPPQQQDILTAYVIVDNQGMVYSNILPWRIQRIIN